MNTVSENIFHELDFFAVSFMLGILLVLVYDCLRIFRQLVRHGAVWLSLEDLAYWIFTAFAVFSMLYQKNDGLIRGFSIGGVVLGMLLYNQFISRFIVRYIVLFLNKIINIVFAPFWKASKGLKNLVKYLKKRLKKMKNEIKMGVTKK